MSAPDPSRLDANQVLQGSFDEATGRLRTDSLSTVVNADIDVALDANEDSVKAWVTDETGAAFTDINYLPIGQTSHDRLLVKALITGLNPDGVFVNDPISGVVSSNSTSTPLAAGATFTGTYTDCSQYANISILLKADQISAVNGVKVQYSHNGVTVVRELVTTILPLDNGIYVALTPSAKFFRVSFTNGAVPQTSFVIQTQLHESAAGSTVVPINFPLLDTNSILVNRSIITGKSTDGAYLNQRAPGVSTLNSTSAPLGINGIFNGTFEEILGYTNIAISVFSDKASSSDGFIVEYSSDGINVDSTEVYSISANNGGQYSFGVLSKYFRLRYVNGPSAQSIFRLQTIYHIAAPKPSSHRIDDLISGQNDAELTKSILTGKQENGSFNNVALSNSGSLKVAVTDRPSEVRNRTKVEARIFNTPLTPTPTILHTVTVGKIFYLESMIISALNQSNLVGEWRVTDNGIDKFGYLMADKATGTPAAISTSSPALPEPIPFTTNFGVREVAGDVYLSIYIIGYEE